MFILSVTNLGTGISKESKFMITSHNNTQFQHWHARGKNKLAVIIINSLTFIHTYVGLKNILQNAIKHLIRI